MPLLAALREGGWIDVAQRLQDTLPLGPLPLGLAEGGGRLLEAGATGAISEQDDSLDSTTLEMEGVEQSLDLTADDVVQGMNELEVSEGGRQRSEETNFEAAFHPDDYANDMSPPPAPEEWLN